MITTQTVIILVGKIAIGLSSIVAISTGVSYFHSFTLKKKGMGNMMQRGGSSFKRGGVFDDED